jgi:hypothetical protein
LRGGGEEGDVIFERGWRKALSGGAHPSVDYPAGGGEDEEEEEQEEEEPWRGLVAAFEEREL